MCMTLDFSQVMTRAPGLSQAERHSFEPSLCPVHCTALITEKFGLLRGVLVNFTTSRVPGFDPVRFGFSNHFS